MARGPRLDVRWRSRGGLARGLEAVASAAALSLLLACAPSLPANSEFERAEWLAQNWSDEERFWFHHATQGTATLPVDYGWLMALEQPEISWFGDPPLLMDEEYLRRFGFIPSPRELAGDARSLHEYGYTGEDRQPYTPKLGGGSYEGGNPDGLPVGFARLEGAIDPVSGDERDLIGFTCAACHTGHLEYAGTSVRIDGAPAITDLGKFREVLGLALAYTKYVPFRFGRFADRVLGENHTSEQEARLKARLERLLERAKALIALKKPIDEDPRNVAEGFARLDALNRIGNQVFFQDLLDPNGGDPADAVSNYEPLTAPVNFPHIWGTSWFDWVQYDASIMQPMIRNAGEAMGVSALINLVKPGETLYDSTVEVRNIFEMEQLLAGDDPHGSPGGPGFRGLRAPRWPEDVLGKIDSKKHEAGQALYDELCQDCHLPPPHTPAFWSDPHWTKPNEVGLRYLKLRLIETDFVGTDPAQAAIMVERTVRVPAHLGIDPSVLGCQADPPPPGVQTELPFAFALGVVVEKTADKWYDGQGTAPAVRERMNGYRPNCLQAELGYKARPLDGIWATAPFLHNGAVANLYDLLSPVEERSQTFYLGSRVFDPEKVGYETGSIEGGFLLDTREPGNSNRGHEFKDGPKGGGVIGRLLAPEERWALIEYLKQMDWQLAGKALP